MSDKGKVRREGHDGASAKTSKTKVSRSSRYSEKSQETVRNLLDAEEEFERAKLEARLKREARERDKKREEEAEKDERKLLEARLKLHRIKTLSEPAESRDGSVHGSDKFLDQLPEAAAHESTANWIIRSAIDDTKMNVAQPNDARGANTVAGIMQNKVTSTQMPNMRPQADFWTSSPYGQTPNARPSANRANQCLNPGANPFRSTTQELHDANPFSPIQHPCETMMTNRQTGDIFHALERTLASQQELSKSNLLPPMTRERFGGDKTKFASFHNSFVHHVEINTSDPQRRLAHLYSQLDGLAKTLVEGCLSLPPVEGYAKAWALLRHTYAQTEEIEEAYIRKLPEFDIITNK